MNEQDIMKRLEEQASDITIPDSISPLNMKIMLDEAIENGTINDGTTGNITNYNKLVKRLTIAACFGLIIGGGVFAFVTINNPKSETTSLMADEACMEESFDEELYDITKAMPDEAVADSCDEAAEDYNLVEDAEDIGEAKDYSEDETDDWTIEIANTEDDTYRYVICQNAIDKDPYYAIKVIDMSKDEILSTTVLETNHDYEYDFEEISIQDNMLNITAIPKAKDNNEQTNNLIIILDINQLIPPSLIDAS